MQESPPGVEVKLGQLGTLHIPVYSNTGGRRGGEASTPPHIPCFMENRIKVQKSYITC